MSINHIQISAEAVSDLEVGKQFYDQQENGVGDYFWDSLISDIESLIIYAAVHSKVIEVIKSFPKKYQDQAERLVKVYL